MRVDIIDVLLAFMKFFHLYKALANESVVALTAPAISLILQNAKQTPHHFSPLIKLL